MSIALEILRSFRRLRVSPVRLDGIMIGKHWRNCHCACSQYGYTLAICGSYKEALRFTFNYYAANMQLIRQ